MGNNTIAAVPITIDVLGSHVPALSLLIGLIAVTLVRIMVASREPVISTQGRSGWWFHNVALTGLLLLTTFVIIIDRQLGPGMSLICGVGIGASGVLIVDIMKKRVEGIIHAMTGGNGK